MNTIRELEQQEKYKNMLKRKNKEIERLNNELELYKDNHEHLNNLLQQMLMVLLLHTIRL